MFATESRRALDADLIRRACFRRSITDEILFELPPTVYKHIHVISHVLSVSLEVSRSWQNPK